MSEWIEEQDPTLYCLKKIHPKYKDTNRLKGVDRKDIQYEQSSKERWSGYSSIRYGRFQNKERYQE